MPSFYSLFSLICLFVFLILSRFLFYFFSSNALDFTSFSSFFAFLFHLLDSSPLPYVSLSSLPSPFPLFNGSIYPLPRFPPLFLYLYPPLPHMHFSFSTSLSPFFYATSPRFTFPPPFLFSPSQSTLFHLSIPPFHVLISLFHFPTSLLYVSFTFSFFHLPFLHLIPFSTFPSLFSTSHYLFPFPHLPFLYLPLFSLHLFMSNSPFPFPFYPLLCLLLPIFTSPSSFFHDPASSFFLLSISPSLSLPSFHTSP